MTSTSVDVAFALDSYRADFCGVTATHSGVWCVGYAAGERSGALSVPVPVLIRSVHARRIASRFCTVNGL